MDTVAVLAALGGVARSSDLIRAGVSTHQLSRALGQRDILRPARGVYCLPGRDDALFAAACVRGELACISAAQKLGLWVLREPSLVHISVNHGRNLGATFRVHRAPRPLAPLTVCLQVMRCLPELDALCIVESAVVLRLVTLAQLRLEVGGQRDTNLRAIVELVDPHAQSIIETIARYHLKRAGLNTQSQVYVRGVGRLDLFVDGVLGIEADGREFHSDRQDFAEDRRRWNLLTTHGIPILRVTHSLLTRDPDEFLDLVRRALASHTRLGR